MPYLQLDVPAALSVDVKRQLTRRLAELFAEIMQTTQDKVVVAFNELPEGSLWRCTDDGLHPGAVLRCDIRHGRPPQQRARFAEALLDACAEFLGLDQKRMSVMFTQHAGDEIFRGASGLEHDWTPGEAGLRRKAAGLPSP
jgi:phenylpyruvate tautomerase PptA (4-oxalocrotonate tautomerase family)